MGYETRNQKHALSFESASASKHSLRNICPTCGREVVAITTRGPTDQRAAPCGHSIRHVTMHQFTSDSDATSGGIER